MKVLFICISVLGLVLAGCSSEQKADVEAAAESAADHAESAVETAKETADDVKEGAESVAEGAKESLEDAKEGVESAAEKAKEAVGDLVDLGNHNCPVCGMHAHGEDFAAYEGKKINVCSKGCGEAFLKDAEKYMADLQKKVPEAVKGMGGE